MLEASFRENWEHYALSNYGGDLSYRYKDLGSSIASLHLAFAKAGLKKGDKVALCGKNHANWILSFLSIFTYGAVPVPLLHEFKPANIHHLVNHSESRLLFVDEQIWENLDINEMPSLEGIVDIGGLTVISSVNRGFGEAMSSLQELMDERYPDGFTRDDISYDENNPDDLAIINYTSGTSGFSKGVMLSYRSVWSNMDFGLNIYTGLDNASKTLAILPCAHMYGLMFETFFQICCGVHIHYLTRLPSPNIILKAMADIRPRLILFVPLVIEKVYRSTILPRLQQPVVRKLRKYLPGFECILLRKIRRSLVEAFGGDFTEIIIGGAAFNKEVEAFFHKMRFPFTVGYGMTECGPIITYCHWKDARVGASGTAAPNMEIRVDSTDPRHIAGEIQCRGANVFMGYYKNEEQTAQAFTEDGWFRTGDMGVIDEDGYLYIKGRSKCMILGASGQNIYPEELEAMLNNLTYVADSLVIDNKGEITALVFPNFPLAEKRGMNEETLRQEIEAGLASVNADLPNYSQIKALEIRAEDFERTPKKSIKRYLYQR
ncbi:MAG: AMP-binding protein [Bacteroidales bacterium]|nr:AMP-binding protein [Candidatus Hennigimonas equi]